MDKKTITNEKLIKKLEAPFPDEALAPVQKGKGFYLTTIKAQYVISRLNEVFGPCGIGWKFTSSFENFNSKYIICFLELSVKVNGEWSEAIAGVGGHKVVGELADTYKSAQTDALTKAASKLGIGDNVFKGMVNPLDLIKRDADIQAKVKKTEAIEVIIDEETGEVIEDEILEEARSKMWHLMRKKGIDVEKAKIFIEENYGKTRSSDMNIDEINDAIDVLSSE